MTFDPANRVTNADVIHALADQLPDWFRVSDFVPVPCCFPTCRSMTYALVDGDTVVPITRLLDVEDYLDYITNRVCPPPPSARRWRSCGAPPPSPAAPAPTTNSTSWAAGPPAVRA